MWEQANVSNDALVRQLREGESDRCVLEKRYVRKNGEVMWSRTTVTLLMSVASLACSFSFGWMVGLPLALLALFMAIRFVPAHVNESTDPVDNLGGILSVVLIGTFVLALNFLPVACRRFRQGFQERQPAFQLLHRLDVRGALEGPVLRGSDRRDHLAVGAVSALDLDLLGRAHLGQVRIREAPSEHRNNKRGDCFFHVGPPVI